MTDRPACDVNVFVAPVGNGFMHDIASWIVEAAVISGRRAAIVTDRLPNDDGSINLVVAPHEFYLFRDDSDAAIRQAARVSVPICTEQPGTPWFLLALGFCEESPLVLDINQTGAAAIAAQGFDVRHLALGAVPSMNRRVHEAAPERDVDVTFLGGNTPHRSAQLGRLAHRLWNRQTEIRMFSTSQPITGREPGVVFGAEKYDLLARSRILLNVHRDESEHGYFEWARVIEAMANGCVVVSEESRGYEPLEPGRHFVQAEDLGAEIDRLLQDPALLERIAASASEFVLQQRPLASTLEPLLVEAERAVHRRHRSEGSRSTKRGRRRTRRPIQRDHRPPLMPAFAPYTALRERTYAAWLAETMFQRRIDAVRCLARFGSLEHLQRTTTTSYDDAVPEVSVIVTVYDYEDVVGETLASIIESRDVDYEIVVVDDHSTDDGRRVVQEFMDGHPEIPMVLLGRDSNGGLPAARNLAFAEARADRVMVMDADNLIYPNCLRVLSDALDDDPAAAFAYTTLEDFGDQAGVRSALGWWVPWLCEQNYIDAQAMIRRDAWERLGGYRVDDTRWFGWEDWGLWLRMAAAGDHGVHVPRILGRYRTHSGSMISITNLAASAMRAHLRELHPELPWPS